MMISLFDGILFSTPSPYYPQNDRLMMFMILHLGTSMNFSGHSLSQKPNPGCLENCLIGFDRYQSCVFYPWFWKGVILYQSVMVA